MGRVVLDVKVAQADLNFYTRKIWLYLKPNYCDKKI